MNGTKGQINVFEIPFQNLDASNSAELKDSILSIIKQQPNLILDLNRLQFLDSSGLGVLLASLRRANALGGDIRMCNLTRPVRSILELVRMHRVFEIFNDVEEARASFAPGDRSLAAL